VWRFIVWSLRLRRVEYRVAELPIYLVPAFLAVPDPTALGGLVFWEGLVAFLFLFAFGDLLNCLADRDLDAVYKPHLTEAVDGLGVRGVLVQAALSAAAAVALTTHLAWLLGRWHLVPLVLAGLFVALAYSVEPFRLKGRGLWQLAFYWLGLFTGPMLFAAFLFDPLPAWPVWMVAGAFGMLQTGVILVNTAEDFPEDRAMGVRTVIVALGLRGGIGLAAGLTAVGGGALLVGLAVVFVERSVPSVGWWGLVPALAAWLAASVAGLRLWRLVRAAAEADAGAAVRRAAKWVPVWITSGALGSLVASAVVCFAGRPG
jgi:4-hydroxybenzoate polyprenyltransferase